MQLSRLCAGRFLLVLLAAGAACGRPETVVTPPHDYTRPNDLPWSGVPGLGELLRSIQDATWGYREERLALADGYIPAASGCEQTSAGSMGHRYVNSSLVGLVPGSKPITGTDNVIDLLRPEGLLYEPQEVGPAELVGVVYLVYRQAWESVHGDPPTFFGTPFYERFGDAARDHTDYYEYTVWLWRQNPAGLFAPWNPLVTC